MFQVHDLMEDIAEQQEVANEIAEAISNPVGFGQDVDEDELLKELEELEQVLSNFSYFSPFSVSLHRIHFSGGSQKIFRV